MNSKEILQKFRQIEKLEKTLVETKLMLMNSEEFQRIKFKRKQMIIPSYLR